MWYLVGVPIALAAIGFFLAGKRRYQVQSIVGLLVLVGLIEVWKAGGINRGQTWAGYALILLVPFGFAWLGILMARRFPTPVWRQTLLAFLGIPALFLFGVLVAVSVAVNLGWASP